MEPRNAIKKLTKSHKKIMQILLILPLAIILISLFSAIILFPFLKTPSTNRNDRQPPLPPSLNSFTKRACSETLYSSLCISTLSSTTDTKNFTTFTTILLLSINRTAGHVLSTRDDIVSQFTRRDLNAPEKNALQDCVEMLDQTSYELQQAVRELGSLSHRQSSSYGKIKTLLSAAMTNENTCINGFSDLEKLDLDSNGNVDKIQKGHRMHIQNMLTPISHMISNSLALIKHFEKKKVGQKSKMVIRKGLRHELPKNVRVNLSRRKKSTRMRLLRENVIVASDGSGNCTTIGEAIAMAPNMSRNAYVIRVRAGVYDENVLIPREKINVMLIGDGMNATIITGSRNIADGFSTFASATLTVVGDKFLARDLTIRNTSPPEKFQAVALRVTSNAAFYRCNIISYQDTLYAHSLRQFYHGCTIQGTVDFIFGNAAAVFQNCTILVRKPITGQSNVITAQGREDPNQNTGFILQKCTIEAAGDFNFSARGNFSTYLGRPWRNYSRTVVMDSYMGDLINARGWKEWGRYSSLDTVEYIECMNSGPGANTRGRVEWAAYRRNCSGEIVKSFRVGEFLHGGDGWLQSTVLPLFGGL